MPRLVNSYLASSDPDATYSILSASPIRGFLLAINSAVLNFVVCDVTICCVAFPCPQYFNAYPMLHDMYFLAIFLSLPDYVLTCD